MVRLQIRSTKTTATSQVSLCEMICHVSALKGLTWQERSFIVFASEMKWILAHIFSPQQNSCLVSMFLPLNSRGKNCISIVIMVTWFLMLNFRGFILNQQIMPKSTWWINNVIWLPNVDYGGGYDGSVLCAFNFSIKYHLTTNALFYSNFKMYYLIAFVFLTVTMDTIPLL